MQSIRIAVLALALCFGASLLPVQSHAAAPLPKVKIETSMGDIVVELNPAKAPKTVSNFLYYVKSGFYNNTIFHRVINGFMIQGGGHTADMQEKANSRKPVVNEAGNGLKNDAYTIAMARTNDPDSATAQFFINVANNTRTKRRPATAMPCSARSFRGRTSWTASRAYPPAATAPIRMSRKRP